mmetsp:Transcript_147260/g.257253  ORF Transcript_147260/g.257253 Transcript_147260/m.257253 type:complete len:295 (-) Transcript_147260:627-1511(-)
MVTVSYVRAKGTSAASTANPASWYANSFFSPRPIRRLWRSGPTRKRSQAKEISSSVISVLSYWAVVMAASLRRFRRSLGLKPNVSLAIADQSRFSAIAIPVERILRISSRSSMSGYCRLTCRLNRPGRSRAGSRAAAFLVAAKTMRTLFTSRLSISASSWFMTVSGVRTSSSSMKMTHGVESFASAKILRIRAEASKGDSTYSVGDHVNRGTPASEATALAISVLPVPEGPVSRQPFGILAPRLVYLEGFERKSTTSCKSAFAFAEPPTFAKLGPLAVPAAEIEVLASVALEGF